MHIPDGFIEAPVAAAAGVVAVAGLALCLRKASRELDDRTAPRHFNEHWKINSP